MWKDLKYINYIQSSLNKFKVLSTFPSYLASFRCVYCGDSKKSSAKKRAYFIQKSSDIYFYCHNCFRQKPFYLFLKEVNPLAYDQYRFEDFRPKKKEPDLSKFKTHTEFRKGIDLGVCLSTCSEDDPVLRYAISRKIPSKFFSSLYSSSVFNLSQQMQKYADLSHNRDRSLVIPFLCNEKNEYSYLTLRSIEETPKIRYLVLSIDEKTPKIWGLKDVDWSQKIHVFEGPIDAMMVPNSIALASAGGSSSIQYIRNHINSLKDVCFVYDNEIRRNRQIRSQVQQRIQEGFSVFIPDSKFKSKDANEAICSNRFDYSSLHQYIIERSFNGMQAQLELSNHVK